MKKSLSILLALTLSISSLLVGCGDQKVSQEDNPDSITVTYVTSPLNVPSIIEKKRVFLRKSLEEKT